MHRAAPSTLVLVLALMLALAGCVDDGQGDAAELVDAADETVVTDEAGGNVEVEETDGLVVVQGDEDAAEALQEAVAATADGDAEVRFTTAVDSAVRSDGVIGEGVSDGDDLRVTMDVRGPLVEAFGATETQVEVRVIDGTVYTSFPLLLAELDTDAEWVVTSLDGLDADVGDLYERARLARPADALAMLDGVTAVADLGEERVDGESTTHYVATVEVADALAAAGVGAEAMSEMGADPDRAVEVHAYVGEDGLVRRVAAGLDNDGSTFEVVVDFLDHEVEADIDLPAEADTITLEEVLRRRAG